MRTKETSQLVFDFGRSAATLPTPTPEDLKGKEQELRIKSLITFSQIEKIIYRQICKVEPKNFFDAAFAIGAAIDWFLVPANFIYRYRDNYCFPPDQYSKWDLKTIFGSFYPTGWKFEEILAFLEKHRPDFWHEKNPLTPNRNPSLERGNIKLALIPLWEEVGREFKLDQLNFQNIMTQDGNFLLPAGRTASAETISEIGQRIVTARFDVLVDDDKNYTYLAKPDCLLKFEVAGVEFNILVQPDYIKRLREDRKTVQKRNIVIKRIVGDFKDSNIKDLEDFEKPFGQVMSVYNFLLSQIGEKFKQNQPQRIRLANRQVRRVFIIPEVVAKPVPSNRIQTALEFLREDGEQIFSAMPQITPELTEFAKNLLEKALKISQKVKI